MFSQVKQNSQLIIVESGNNFKVYRAQVTDVGNQTTVMNSANQAVQVVSVIKATDGQQPFEFKEIPSGTAVFTYPNGTIVATSTEVMAAEMRRLNAVSRDVISSIPKYQHIQAGTEYVLEEIDPEYAEKKQMREQIELLKKQNEELKMSKAEMDKALADINAEIKSLRKEVKTPKGN